MLEIITHEKRSADILITERSDLINLFSSVAKAIDPAYLHDRKKLPVIRIEGGYNSGKSLAIESMMRTWIDTHDVRDLHEQEKNHMFMEKQRCDAASYVGVSDVFNVAGKKTALFFSSSFPNAKTYIGVCKDKMKARPSIEGGAIFAADHGNRMPLHMTWITASVDFADKQSKANWNRVVSISVTHTKNWRNPLLNDTGFRTFWNKMPDTIFRLNARNPTP